MRSRLQKKTAIASARFGMSGSTGDDLDYDVLVVGSGFGGSVTALRLTEVERLIDAGDLTNAQLAQAAVPRGDAR